MEALAICQVRYHHSMGPTFQLQGRMAVRRAFCMSESMPGPPSPASDCWAVPHPLDIKLDESPLPSLTLQTAIAATHAGADAASRRAGIA
jgi:hypothetical protein